MTNPLDNLETQLPGRLLAVETLLMLLLGKHADAGQIFETADRLIEQAEAQTFGDGVANGAYALEMFAAARTNLDALRENVRRIQALGDKF